MELPKTKSPALFTDPRSILIMSKPKVGKTRLVSELDNNLVIDINDGGSGFYESMRIQPTNWKEIVEITKEIKKQGCPYDYITVDTIGDLEDMCVDLAEHLFSKTAVGKYWFTKKSAAEPSGKEKYGSILNLPEGAGFGWIRLAMKKMIENLRSVTNHLILLGHVRDKDVTKSDKSEVDSIEVDLLGKLRTIVPSNVDAVGYMYRKSPNVNVINFTASKDVVSGSRADLEKELIISEINEKGEYVTHWNKIFKNLKSK